MTSTLAIHPKRVKLYRVLWDRWIIVLRILFDLGAGAHPVKWRAVADTLLVDKKTVQKYMAGLVRDGHITAAGEGFMLTEAGMSVLLENEQGDILPAGEKISGKNSQLLESVVVVVNPESNLTTTTTQLGKNLGEKFSPSEETVGEFFDADVQAALDHADLLFDGATLAKQGLDYYLHIEKVLGWLAYCYDRRGGLYGPAGLVRKNLKDPAAPMPPMKYMKNPLSFFPDEYLDAIGKWHETCDRCQQEFTHLADYTAHLESCLMTFIEEADDQEQPEVMKLQADETITDAVRKAWDGVLATLRDEMPQASFDTWVQSATPIHVDEQGWQVVTRNSYARDWLASRMSGTFARLVGRPVTFVVSVAVETEEE